MSINIPSGNESVREPDVRANRLSLAERETCLNGVWGGQGIGDDEVGLSPSDLVDHGMMPLGM